MTANLERIEKVYQDEQNLFEALHPDVEWHEMEGFPYGGIYRGKEALMAGVFARLQQDWDDFGATPHTYLPSGDRVVTLGHYHGRSRRTGRALRADFAHVYTLDEKGRITHFRQYGDSAVFRAALG